MLTRWPQDKRAETVRRCIVPQPVEHELQREREREKSIPVAFRRSTELQTASVQKGRPEDVAWAEAFKQLVRYCAENDEQITITDLCEKLKEYLMETRRTQRNT